MDRKKTLISVVMPVYNVALYIVESVTSILNQTIIDFELLIIDDCSSDNTLSILEEIKDDRIKIIRKEKNLGLVHSLNLGFELAQGKYIARMDGDDISVKDRFEKQLAILEQNPNIILCGSWIQHFGKSREIVKFKESHEEIVIQMLLYCSLSFGTAMLRRKSLALFKFNESKKHVEDYDFLSRIVWEGELHNIQEVLYHYRVHDNQVSALYKNIQIEGDIPIKLSLFKKLNYDTNKYSDELISKMLLLNQYITVNDLDLFLKWLQELVLLNNKTNIYSNSEFKKILYRIRRSLLFSLYFKKTIIGIDKQWRKKALFKLEIKDAFYILKIKIREISKRIVKL